MESRKRVCQKCPKVSLLKIKDVILHSNKKRYENQIVKEE